MFAGNPEALRAFEFGKSAEMPFPNDGGAVTDQTLLLPVHPRYDLPSGEMVHNQRGKQRREISGK